MTVTSPLDPERQQFGDAGAEVRFLEPPDQVRDANLSYSTQAAIGRLPLSSQHERVVMSVDWLLKYALNTEPPH